MTAGRNKWFKDWTPLPVDFVVFYFPVFFALLAGTVGPGLLHQLVTNPWLVFVLGVIAGVMGVGLLFVARLPLYRHCRFFTIGPWHLDASHRRLYRWAYGFVAVAVVLLVLLWMSLKSCQGG